METEKNLTDADLQAQLDAANAQIAALKSSPGARENVLQTALDKANAEIARLQSLPNVVTVPNPATKQVVIPREFPEGFGYTGRRDSLSNYQGSYLQKCWSALPDAEKVKHLLRLEQFAEQTVAHAPTVPAS